MLNEQPHLLPLAAEPFDLAEISFATVDSLRCVRVRTNRYSVPLPPGTKVEARVASRLRSSYGMVASALPDMNAATAASRRYSIWNTIWRCCARSRERWPVRRRWRSGGRRGAGPQSFDQLWQALNTRHGRAEGTRQMIDLLELGAGHGWDRLRVAVEQALRWAAMTTRRSGIWSPLSS